MRMNIMGGDKYLKLKIFTIILKSRLPYARRIECSLEVFEIAWLFQAVVLNSLLEAFFKEKN